LPGCASRRAHSATEFRKTEPSPGAPTKIGIALRAHSASRPSGDLVALLQRRVALAEQVAELGPCHAALEFGLPQQRAHEAILVEQQVLVESPRP
jgi:hypothetical protein